MKDIRLETIYFLRHGETDMNRERRCQGRINVPLNEEGKRQAGQAAEVFSDIRIDEIYASPLGRAVDSALPVAVAKGLDVHIHEWLSEIDHGEAEGLDEREAEEKFPGLIQTWMSRPDEVRFPGGETLEAVAARVGNGLLEVLEKSEARSALFVTHQVISGVARCLLLGLPLSKVWEEKLLNGSYFRFDLTPEMIGMLANGRRGVK